jgi:hypothetical protein
MLKTSPLRTMSNQEAIKVETRWNNSEEKAEMDRRQARLKEACDRKTSGYSRLDQNTGATW